MRYILFIIAFTYCTGLAAAEVTVTACASATVTQTTIPQRIEGFPEECIELSSILEPEDDGSFESKSESKTLEFAFGGCADLGADTAYTMEHRWRYSITTEAGPGEKANAFVTYDLAPERYTEGQGEYLETVNGEVEVGACEDGLFHLSAGFEISTGLDSSTLVFQQDFSGLFYDPDKPGHGFDFNAHEQGLIIYYYGHTANGDRLWLISEVLTEKLEFGRPIDLLMYEVTDGVFGQPEFSPSEWGRALITLFDCDNGQADLDGEDGEISTGLARLTGPGGTSCE